MRAFWWFEENEIAGMARPGFNCTPWFDFSFEEAILVGWLGQFSSGSTSRGDFHDHVRDYGTKVLKFYKLDAESAAQATSPLKTRPGLLDVLKRISERSQLLESYDVTDDHIHFEFSKKRLNWEIDYLKRQGIEKIVTLTEQYHDKALVGEHFEVHHFSITDMEPPRIEQVSKFAEIIRTSQASRKTLAVHCLAGIGRTSTMLMGAHLAMGQKLDELKIKIVRRNPSFNLTGSQGEFLKSLAERFNA